MIISDVLAFHPGGILDVLKGKLINDHITNCSLI